jgi:hypothetical protein
MKAVHSVATREFPVALQAPNKADLIIAGIKSNPEGFNFESLIEAYTLSETTIRERAIARKEYYLQAIGECLGMSLTAGNLKTCNDLVLVFRRLGEQKIQLPTEVVVEIGNYRKAVLSTAIQPSQKVLVVTEALKIVAQNQDLPEPIKMDLASCLKRGGGDGVEFEVKKSSVEVLARSKLRLSSAITAELEEGIKFICQKEDRSAASLSNNEHDLRVNIISLIASKGVLSNTVKRYVRRLLADVQGKAVTCDRDRAILRTLVPIAAQQREVRVISPATTSAISGEGVLSLAQMAGTAAPPSVAKPCAANSADGAAAGADTAARQLLFTQFQGLNNGKFDAAYIADLQHRMQQVDLACEQDSKLAPQGMPVREWGPPQLQSWAKVVREGRLLSSSSSAHSPVDERIYEVIAVAGRAIGVHTGHRLRDVQQLALLTLLKSNDRGMLAEIKTGEGKSTTCAMLTSIKVLQGETVDVITSSPILAMRDSEEWQGFYQLLGISSSHNVLIGYKKGPKECYTKDVVYGDVASFQYDLLRDDYKALRTRADRPFGTAIVDEVDSMLVDDGAKIAKLSGSIPSMEYLQPLLTAIWYQCNQIDLSILIERRGKIEEELSGYITDLITSQEIKIPVYLREFALSQASNWARSSIDARLMVPSKDYLVINSKHGQGQVAEGGAPEEVIAPIDYANTGIIQENTSLMHGLQQFLQLKAKLRMTPEGLTTSFISNMRYFKRYGNKVYGMTGTLGSEDSQGLLSKVYDIDLAFVPKLCCTNSFYPNLTKF